jgi:hypothetical protein
MPTESRKEVGRGGRVPDRPSRLHRRGAARPHPIWRTGSDAAGVDAAFGRLLPPGARGECAERGRRRIQSERLMEAVEVDDDRLALIPVGIGVLIVHDKAPVGEWAERGIAVLRAEPEADIGGEAQIAVLRAIHIQSAR